MNPSSFIAKRYFTAKKSRNFIQVLSWISMIGVAVGTTALVVVLSVFNGLQDLVRSVYSSFDAEIKIEATIGKSFEMTSGIRESLEGVTEIKAFTEVIEDNALIMYRDQQVVARIKGVNNTYLELNRLDTFLLRGQARLAEEEVNYAILGSGVAYELSLMLDSDHYSMQMVYPKKLRPGAPVSRNSVKRKSIVPAGIFSIEQEYNENYVFVPLGFAEELMDYGDKRTAIEVFLNDRNELATVKEKLADLLGDDFVVLDSDEQHSGLLKAIKIEKLFVFITLSFITAIAAFNVFFTLSMLAIEKKKDISVLYAMGATNKLIRQIFLKEGAMIAFIGCIVGLVLGLGLALIQQEYELVGMGMQSAIVMAYPVKIQASDFLLVGTSISLITILTSYRPALIASRVNITEHLG
ncbi:MAG: ABC transporter permease [Roseivirga sp.]|nr:ABC transporter permease [Roseivirga sp.]